MTQPPKEVWVNVGPNGDTAYTFPNRQRATERCPSDCTPMRFLLAPEHRAPKREVVAWVVREGADRKRGDYRTNPGKWNKCLSLACRWTPTELESAKKCADLYGGRVVALVRKAVKS